MVLIFGVPAAIVLGLIPGPRTWRLAALWLVWFCCLASQTAYLAHPGVTGFFGVDGLDAVQGHNLVYWLGQPLLAAALVVIMVQVERLRPGLHLRIGLLALALVLAVCGGLSGCSDHPAESTVAPSARSTSSAPAAGVDVDGLVDVGGGRKIYVRCTGTGSPTIILEGGDEDTRELLCLCRGGPRRGDTNVRLRPGEPRLQRPGP